MQHIAHKKSHSPATTPVTDIMSSPVSSRKISMLFSIGLVIALVLSVTIDASANERDRYKRVYDRLAGVPPTPAEMTAIMDMTTLDLRLAEASNRAMANPSFYNVTLKNFAAPWTNEAQNVFEPLNDYSATVIGMIRDDEDFRKILYDNVIYTSDSATTPYRNTDNQHYIELEGNNADLSSAANLSAKTQTAVTGLPADATAGIMTTRAAARAYLVDGTNRAMFRFTMLNHLCYDMEQLKDNTRTADRVRQDVSRSPGGDSRIFFTNCLACHAGMDPMVQAFAYYEWGYKDIDPDDPDVGRLLYSGGASVAAQGTVQPKYHINATNFKGGYITPDNRWSNYWRRGPNAWLGWGETLPAPTGEADTITVDAKEVSHGTGAKSLGMELAYSDAFARCQVKKVFQTVCLRSPDNREDAATKGGNDQFDNMVNAFKLNGNMKTVFKSAAEYCANASGL